MRLRYIRDTRGTVLPDRARGFPCFFHALLESFREFFAEILVIFEIAEIVSFMRVVLEIVQAVFLVAIAGCVMDWIAIRSVNAVFPSVGSKGAADHTFTDLHEDITRPVAGTLLKEFLQRVPAHLRRRFDIAGRKNGGRQIDETHQLVDNAATLEARSPYDQGHADRSLVRGAL